MILYLLFRFGKDEYYLLIHLLINSTTVDSPKVINTWLPIHTSFPIHTLSSSNSDSKVSFEIHLSCSAFNDMLKIGDVERHFKEWPLIPILQLSAMEQNFPIFVLSITVLADI